MGFEAESRWDSKRIQHLSFHVLSVLILKAFGPLACGPSQLCFTNSPL